MLEVEDYYNNHIIATVEFIGDCGSFRVLGGHAEKRALKEAMGSTPECYVRDIISGQDVLLCVKQKRWTRKLD